MAYLLGLVLSIFAHISSVSCHNKCEADTIIIGLILKVKIESQSNFLHLNINYLGSSLLAVNHLVLLPFLPWYYPSTNSACTVMMRVLCVLIYSDLSWHSAVTLPREVSLAHQKRIVGGHKCLLASPFDLSSLQKKRQYNLLICLFFL